MVAFTVRLIPSIDQELDIISEHTGVVKTSLILFALNDILRRNQPIKETIGISLKESEPFRKSVRFPDPLKVLLEHRSAKEGISANTFINSAIHQVNRDYWMPLIQEATT